MEEFIDYPGSDDWTSPPLKPPGIDYWLTPYTTSPLSVEEELSVIAAVKEQVRRLHELLDQVRNELEGTDYIVLISPDEPDTILEQAHLDTELE